MAGFSSALFGGRQQLRSCCAQPSAAAARLQLSARLHHRRQAQTHSGPSPPDGDGGPEGAGGELLLPPRPKKPSQLQPSFWLSREDALEAQLKALQHNTVPHSDAGIEAVYRFTDFDPFDRTTYFGLSLDLGEFERFKRIFYTPYYITLINLSSWEVTSTLEVSERVWVARVHVVNAWRKEERDYSVTMQRRLGGHFDGVWHCSKLVADGVSPKTLYGVI